MAICGASIYIFRGALGSLFTEGDDKVAAAIALIAPLGAAYQARPRGERAGEGGVGSPMRARHHPAQSLCVRSTHTPNTQTRRSTTQPLVPLTTQHAPLQTHGHTHPYNVTHTRTHPHTHTRQVGDGILGTSQGVLRALGRQHQLALVNLVAFWLIAVPLGFWLTFHAGGGMGLVGLWIGMATGCFLAASTSCVLVVMVDWHEEERKALELLAAAHDGGDGGAYAAVPGGEGPDAIVQVGEP
jgi:hypothetical protein